MSSEFSFISDGQIIQVPFSVVDQDQQSLLRYAMIYGTATGSCIVLMLVLLLFSKNRKTPMFILNQLTLFFMIIRSALYLTYLMGNIVSISFYITNDLTQDSNPFKSYQIAVVTSVAQIPLVACIQAILVLQVNAIFKSPEVKVLRLFLVAFTASLSTAVLVLYIYNSISYAESARTYYDPSHVPKEIGNWLFNVPFCLFSVSVNVNTFLLMCKLFFAIRSRRYLGLRQFDVYHILFIMSTQTMIAPTILVIVNYTQKSSTQYLSTISFLLVVLSLPLTSMWATSANNSPRPTSSALSFLSRSHSNNSTVVPTSFAFFPSKLTNSASIDLEKNQSPNTIIEPEIVNSLSQTYDSNLPPDIMNIIYDTESFTSDEVKMSTIESQKDGRVIAVKTHTIRP
ncbi:pheromone alpha factor receptor [[Candida] anglica]|uniref:Pheromone alpha factor receptor n=1 Tax=[Candida] anglica TaxID=148631 RepID=A0ABP0E8G2_9ASCO